MPAICFPTEKLGLEATPKNLNDLKLQKANAEKVAQENLEAAQAFAKDLETKEIILTLKVGEKMSKTDYEEYVDVQVVCKVTDPKVLLGSEEVKFTNNVILQNAEGTENIDSAHSNVTLPMKNALRITRPNTECLFKNAASPRTGRRPLSCMSAASHAMADAHASERRNAVQSLVTMASYSSLCVRDSAYSHGDKSSKLESSRIQG